MNSSKNVFTHLNQTIKTKFQSSTGISNFISILLMINPFFTGIYYAYLILLLNMFLLGLMELFLMPTYLTISIVKSIYRQLTELNDLTKAGITILIFLSIMSFNIVFLPIVLSLGVIVLFLGMVANLIVSIDLSTFENTFNYFDEITQLGDDVVTTKKNNSTKPISSRDNKQSSEVYTTQVKVSKSDIKDDEVQSDNDTGNRVMEMLRAKYK